MEYHDLQYSTWHMWLANFGVTRYDRLDPGDRVDICSYIRMVAMGALKLLILTLVGLVLVGWVLFSIGNMFAFLFMGYTLELPAFMFWFFGSLILIGIGFHHGKKKVSDLLYERRIKNWDGKARPKKKPGFLALAYRKFKDKTCFMMEVK